MTECPKCGAAISDGALECARCGVVLAKFRARADAPPADEPLLAPIERPAPVRDSAADHLAGAVRIGRIAALLVLALWTWSFASLGVSEQVGASILHLPNLVFHEAGHVILGFFGRFITVLGGSLFQVVFPLVFAVAFLRQRNPFAAAVCTWWSGQNLVDVAPYIADARALQLVLLGGRTGAEVEGHDWEYLLTELNWLHLDRVLGLWTFRVGVVVMIASIVWGALVVGHRPPARPVDEI